MIVASVMTCAGREVSLYRTLASLRESDLRVDPIVVYDREAIEDVGLTEGHGYTRATIATRHALSLVRARVRDGDLVLFCEDDVDVNRNLRFNIETWDATARVDLATLFYSPHLSAARIPFAGFELVDPERSSGGPCLLLSQRMIDATLDSWGRFERLGGDRQIFLAAARVLKVPVFLHRPGLVVHRPQPSATGNPFGHIAAVEADLDWKRPV